jgi:hypothetical protein
VHRAFGDVARDHAGTDAERAHVRQERDRQAVGDEPERDDAVVGAMADIGIEAAELSAGALGHLRPARAGMAGRPGLGGELGQRHRLLVTERERVILGEHHAHRVAVQVVAVDAGGPGARLMLPLVAEDEIHVAQDQRRQRLLGLGLHELAAQPGRVSR